MTVLREKAEGGKRRGASLELSDSRKLKALVEEGEPAKEAEGQEENQDDAVSRKGRECFQMKGLFKSIKCC